MAEKSSAASFDVFQISKDLLTAQQRYISSGNVYARIAEAMHGVTQANITYVQELMRANAALLAALTERSAAPREEPPSSAVHHRDRAAQ
jgi:hypothetical protein